MEEHDDDLTPEVHEGADLETESFDTEDELDDDDELEGNSEDDEEYDVDEDKSEL